MTSVFKTAIAAAVCAWAPVVVSAASPGAPAGHPAPAPAAASGGASGATSGTAAGAKPGAPAANANNALQQFVRQVQAATGEFTQATVGPQGRTQPAQSGVFSFQRPGKFKWSVTQPYEQLIVSDGNRVQQYDPDLAQITQRNVDQAIGSSPAAILFGSGSLTEAFNVTSLPQREGLQWLRATPKSADAGFSRVDLGFRGTMPERIELLDSFGQTTRVTLSNITPNPTLAPNEFQFTAPAGVDVVKM